MLLGRRELVVRPGRTTIAQLGRSAMIEHPSARSYPIRAGESFQRWSIPKSRFLVRHAHDLQCDQQTIEQRRGLACQNMISPISFEGGVRPNFALAET